MEAEVKNIVKKIQDEHIDQERINKRKEFENSASGILTSRLGELDVKDIEKVIELLDSDYYQGQKENRRFGLALWGRNRKLIVGNDVQKLNRLISEVFGKENLDEIETLRYSLKGIRDCFTSCLLYLKNDEKYNILIGATFEGVKAVFPEEEEIPSTFSFKDRYTHFNKLALKLKEECSLKPQELDIVLTLIPSRIAGVREVVKEPSPLFEVEEVIDIENLSHSDLQGILVELGNLLGYETYVADPSKIYKKKALREWTSLEQIPPFTYLRLLKFIREIDVIWFSNEGSELPIACFEVEHTTNVTDGLLRLYQIKDVSSAKLFIIASSDVGTKFQTEITKDPFYKVRERFLFRTYEQLVEFFNTVKRYQILKKSFIAY